MSGICTDGVSHHVSCKAIFVDTDDVPARDSRVGDLVENQMEARLVHQVTECLLACGAEERQIGVISLYRQQLKLLSHLLRERKGIEMLTADRSQGRDKECVIISLVRSNEEGSVCYPAFRTTRLPWVSDLTLYIVDRGARKRLATDERLLHAGALKVDHHWLSEDPAEGTSPGRILRAHGGSRLDSAPPH